MTINEFLEIDNNFNEAMFLTKVNNIFVKLYTAIMLNELADVKHFISEDIYNFYQNKINELDKIGQRQMYDEINVKNSSIKFIDIDDSKYVINVYLEARYMDYILDLETGDCISGRDDNRIQVNYELRFIRDKEILNQSIVRRCSGCGAPMDINCDGKCNYCGAIYNLSDYDWILDSINIV